MPREIARDQVHITRKRTNHLSRNLSRQDAHTLAVQNLALVRRTRIGVPAHFRHGQRPRRIASPIRLRCFSLAAALDRSRSVTTPTTTPWLPTTGRNTHLWSRRILTAVAMSSFVVQVATSFF